MSKKTIFIWLMIVPLFTFSLFAFVWQDDHSLKINKYYGGIPVYPDRCYLDQIQPEMLENLYIVAISRHFHHAVNLTSVERFTAYRFIAPENNNEFIAGWEKLPVKIDVPGKSSTFKMVYSKSFPPGTWTFEAGGPVAASPLLFKANGETVTANYSTNYLFSGGIMAHKTKLLLIISLFLNYGFAIYFWLYKNS